MGVNAINFVTYHMLVDYTSSTFLMSWRMQKYLLQIEGRGNLILPELFIRILFTVKLKVHFSAHLRKVSNLFPYHV